MTKCIVDGREMEELESETTQSIFAETGNDYKTFILWQSTVVSRTGERPAVKSGIVMTAEQLRQLIAVAGVKIDA